MKIADKKELAEFLLRVHHIALDQFLKSGVCGFDKNGACVAYRARLAAATSAERKGRWSKWVKRIGVLRENIARASDKNCCTGCSELGRDGCMTRNTACALYLCAHLIKTKPKFANRIKRIEKRAVNILRENLFSEFAIEAVLLMYRMRFTSYMMNIAKVIRKR